MTDFEMPSCGKRKPEEAFEGQGCRAVRQAVAEEGNDRDVTRRLVDVLATLSLVNAAELRELTATVFNTYLVPGSESVAEAMAEAGRLCHEQARNRARRRPRATRSPVHVWVAFLRSLATRELAPEQSCGVEVVLGEQRGEERAGTAGGARTALSSEAVQENRGQGRLDAHRVLPGPGHSLPRGSAGGSTAAAERGEEARPRPKRPPRARSVDAPDTDASEAERLAHRGEQHSLRMAELLRCGVLEPSMVYAFLTTKGGQQVPQPKSKAKARARSQEMMNGGAEQTPDVSPSSTA